MSMATWPEVSDVRKDSGLEFLVESARSAYGWAPSKEALAEALSETTKREAALQALETIAASANNAVPGSTEARVGKYHIKLRRLLRSAACSVFFLGVSAVDATKLTLIPAIEQGAEFLMAFAELVEKLTPTEILIFDVVAELEAKNLVLSIDPTKKRGTREDILAVLSERGIEKPLDFSKAMDGLLSKKAIKPKEGSGETVYVTIH